MKKRAMKDKEGLLRFQLLELIKRICKILIKFNKYPKGALFYWNNDHIRSEPV